MVPTTTIGTWVNFGDKWSVSVESTVETFIGTGPSEWYEQMMASSAFDDIVTEYRDAVQEILPEGISLCGNEFIADIDVDYDGDQIREDIEGIDLGEIVARHDVDA